jgi:hypothetical protein
VIDQNLDTEDLTLAPFSDLPVTLTFPEDCTPDPVKVKLFFMDAYPRLEATPGADGRFVLRHVPPVRFGVESFGRNYLWHRSHVRLADDVGGTQIVRFGPAAEGDVLKIEMPCVDSARRP